MQQIEGEKNKEILRDFIKQSKARLQTILDRFEWTEEKVLESYNTNSEAAVKPTLRKSKISKGNEDPFLPENCATKNFVIIEQAELQKLLNDDTVQIPQKFSDLQVNFSREQKCQIYEYVVERTENCTEPKMEVTALNDGNLTFAEIVAMKKRETKKRRKYRTSKPTHIEEVRGLVELQMQALEQYVETKHREQRKRNRSRSKKSIRVRRRSKSHEQVELGRKRRNRSDTETERRKERSLSRSKRKHRSRIRSQNRKEATGQSRNLYRRKDRSRSHHKRNDRSRNKTRCQDRSSSRNRSKSSRQSHSRDKRIDESQCRSLKRKGRSRSPNKIRQNFSSSTNRRNRKDHSRSKSHNRSYKHKKKDRSRSHSRSRRDQSKRTKHNYYDKRTDSRDRKRSPK